MLVSDFFWKKKRKRFFHRQISLAFAYRIYSNKRRIWDKKVNKRRTPDAETVTSKLTERCKLFHNDKGVRSHRW